MRGQRFALSSRPEDSHLRALPDPYVNLSIHTAPDVRPFPWQRRHWAKSDGLTRRRRSNQSRAPLALEDTLARVSYFAMHLEGHLAELDINPLMVLPSGQGVKNNVVGSDSRSLREDRNAIGGQIG